MKRRGGLSPRVAGIILAALGVALGLVSALADVIGVGKPGTTFGYRQFLGTIAGLAMLVVGTAMALYGESAGRGEE